jgi:hypothetical protein
VLLLLHSHCSQANLASVQAELDRMTRTASEREAKVSPSRSQHTQQLRGQHMMSRDEVALYFRDLLGGGLAYHTNCFMLTADQGDGGRCAPEPVLCIHPAVLQHQPAE